MNVDGLVELDAADVRLRNGELEAERIGIVERHDARLRLHVLTDVDVALADDAVNGARMTESPTIFCAFCCCACAAAAENCVVWHCDVVRSYSACEIAPLSEERLDAIALASAPARAARARGRVCAAACVALMRGAARVEDGESVALLHLLTALDERLR